MNNLPWRKIGMALFYVAVAYLLLLVTTRVSFVPERDPIDHGGKTPGGLPTPPQTPFGTPPRLGDMSLEEVFDAAKLAAQDGRKEEAESLFAECAKRAASLDPKDARVVMVLNEQAYFYYLGVGKMPEAETVFKQLIEARKKQLTPDDPQVADDVLKLANLYGFTQRFDEAAATYKQALEIIEKSPSAEQYKPIKARILNDYSGTMRNAKREKEAEELAKQALALK